MAAQMRDTIIHTVTLMQTPRKTTQHKCIKHTYANVSIRFHSVKCFFVVVLVLFFCVCLYQAGRMLSTTYKNAINLYYELFGYS